MVPGGRPLIAIGYTYNMWNVLYFIVTEDTSSTKADITHLSKFPDTFFNAVIHPVARPIAMSKLFGSVSEVDSQNKSSQSDLVLKKFWVTQCGWKRLCKTVDTGITITNFWKIFCYGVKRYHYAKLIDII